VAVPEGVAEQLLAAAKAQGVALTGPGGLLAGLTRQVLESALEAEMTEHLGHPRGGVPGTGGNLRNGHSAKTLRTEVGDIRIKVPRDRAGSFQPAVVPKHSRRLAGFDEAVISLYAKGMTTGDIANHLQDLYGQEVSRDLVSSVTDAIVEDMQAWQNRPLDAVYPVLLIDAIVLKVRDGQVTNRPVYVAVGITLDGQRDVLVRPVGRPHRWGGRQAVDDHAHRPAQPRDHRRPHRLLRWAEGPAGRDHRHLAPGDRPDMCRPSGPEQPAVCVQGPLGENHCRPEEGVPGHDGRER
jgi:hypothetical protein